MPHSRCSKSGCIGWLPSHKSFYSLGLSHLLWNESTQFSLPWFLMEGWEAQRRQWIWPMSFANCSSVPQGNMTSLFHVLSNDRTETTLLIQTLSVFLPGVRHYDVPRNVCHTPNPTFCHLNYTFQAFRYTDILWHMEVLDLCIRKQRPSSHSPQTHQLHT